MRRVGLPGASFALALAVSLAAAVLVDRPDAVLLVAPFGAVGAILAWRRPEHRIGWLFCAFAVIFAFSVFADAYATRGLAADPEWGGARAAAWVFAWLWLVYVTLLELAFLLFPTGRVASARWRWLARAVVAANALFAAARAFVPGPLEGRAIDNPLGLAALAPIADAAGAFILLFLPGILLSLGSPLVRLRWTSGVEREQIKWVGTAGVVLALALLTSGLWPLLGFGPEISAFLSGASYLLGVVAIPVAMGVAILRYRLYDIEILIRRTLIYGSVLAGLAVAYLAAVVLVQSALSPFTVGSEIAVAASTLLTVALFQPLRSGIQRIVDRRFYRQRYDAAQILDTFSVRLRDHVALDAVRTDLLDAVRETVQPAQAGLWLRDGHG